MSKLKKNLTLSAFFVCAITLFARAEIASAEQIPTVKFSVLRTLPHDTAHFTQGLILIEGKLFESAGGYGSSGLHEKNLSSGKSLHSVPLPREVFAEGLTQLGEELFLLSWRNRTAFVFDRSLRERRRLRYNGEGWGLTDDGRQLIMSDGSSTLRWLDPISGKVTREQIVRDGERKLSRLNELEYARGFIFANIWYSDRVAVIAPDTGRVRAWLDLSALRKGFAKPSSWNEQEHVLNGIAYDASTDLFYVTGKCWPLLYELRVAPIPQSK